MPLPGHKRWNVRPIHEMIDVPSLMALILFERPAPSSELFWDDEHEIGWVVHTGESHSEEEARLNIEAAARLTKAQGLEKMPMLVDIRLLRSISREARTLYAGPQNAVVVSAVALVTESSASRVLANFFMALNKPATRTRVFTDTDAAVAWLSEFSNE